MTQKKRKKNTNKTKTPDLDTPATTIPDDAKAALGRCNKHIARNFSGVSSADGELRFVVLRDMGNLMPLIMRCSSAIAAENRTGLDIDEWTSVNEQLGVFTANWMDAWRGHVHDTGNWRAAFADICETGVCGTEEEQKAWLVMADAVLRMMVLAPVYVDMLGAQAFDDIREETASRAMLSVSLAGFRKPMRKEIIDNMVAECNLAASDQLRKVACPLEEPQIRFGRARRWAANVLRGVAARLSGRATLTTRLREMQERRAELERLKEEKEKDESAAE